MLHELHQNLSGKGIEQWILWSLKNCHCWPLFPEPVLLSDDIIDDIGVLKYEATARSNELNNIFRNSIFKKQECSFNDG